MNNSIICIYKITSPSGKIYIGQTTNYRNRVNAYKRVACYKQVKLFNSFKKYGFESHMMEIIVECSELYLNILEEYYIKSYDCFNTEHGLNLRTGGDGGGKMTEESKKKISEGRTGEKHHNFGIKLSKEWKDKISKSNTGKKQSYEAIRKSAEFRKGRVLSDDHKKKMSERQKGKTGHLCCNSIPIIQYDLNGNELKTWDCASDVYRELGYSQRNISSVCRGERRIANGFYWRFYENRNEPVVIRGRGDKKKKKIIQMSLSGEIIKEWESAKDAGVELRIFPRNIRKNCIGEIKSAYGYVWKNKI